MNSFALIDTFLLSYLVEGPHFVSVYSLNSGHELGDYCLRGRGPGESIALTPFFQPGSNADEMYVFDAFHSILQTWDIPASVATRQDVFHNRIHLNSGRKGPFSLSSLYRLDDHSLLVYDACQFHPFILTDIPRYWIFDTATGEITDSIKCFRNVPLKSRKKDWLSHATLMDHTSCLDNEQEKLFLAMRSFPLTAFVDLQNGTVQGFLIKGKPRQNYQDPICHFSSASSSGQFIYCLYYGGRTEQFVSRTIEEEKKRNDNCYLYVMDWEGTARAKYQLDNVYHRCLVLNDTLYLTRLSPSGSGLYTLPLIL